MDTNEKVWKIGNHYFLTTTYKVAIKFPGMSHLGYITDDVLFENAIHAEDYMNKLEGEFKNAIYKK